MRSRNFVRREPLLRATAVRASRPVRCAPSIRGRNARPSHSRRQTRQARRLAAGRDRQGQIAAPHDGGNMEVAKLRHVLDIDQDARSARASGQWRRRRRSSPATKSRLRPSSAVASVHEDGLFHAAPRPAACRRRPGPRLAPARPMRTDCGIEGNGEHGDLHRRPCAGSTQRYVLTPLNARMRWRINYYTVYYA